MSKTQTYEVMVTAYALRMVRVRASSAREATDKAWERVSGTGGAWTIDFPGELDGHFSTTDAAGAWQGPDSSGGYRDEPDDLDDEDDDEAAG